MARAVPIRKARQRFTKARRPKRDRRAERELAEVLNRLEPRVAVRLGQAFQELRGSVSLRLLSDAISAGDVDRAIELSRAGEIGDTLRGIGFEPGERSMMDELIVALQEGGASGARQLSPSRARLIGSLDLTNPEAVQYLQTTLPSLIREVSDESISAVNSALLRGLNEGRPGPLIAREIRDSIGLTEKQAAAVANFRRQLETGELGGGTPPWKRRLNAVERAQARSIFNAPTTSVARINDLVARYYQRLVNRRAANIARTEVHRAFIEGQAVIWDQAVDQGLLEPERTRRIWIVTPDDRLRDSHRAIPGMNKGGVPLDGVFKTPFGPVQSPADPNTNLINCRCTVALRFIDE